MESESIHVVPPQDEPAQSTVSFVLSVEAGRVVKHFDIEDAIERAGAPLECILGTVAGHVRERLIADIESGESTLVYWPDAVGRSTAAAIFKLAPNRPTLFKSTLPAESVVAVTLWTDAPEMNLRAVATTAFEFADEFGPQAGVSIISNALGLGLERFHVAMRLGEWTVFECPTRGDRRMTSKEN